MKGAGFFLGGLALSTLGFRNAAAAMIVLLAAALLIAVALLPRALGMSAQKTPFSSLLARDAQLNWLAAARLFLFASRDVWFVLALPLYLDQALGWDFWRVGGFLALWIIGYGIVQAGVPVFVGRAASGAPDSHRLLLWTTTLMAPLLGVAAFATRTEAAPMTPVIGLLVFAVVFAANSAIHSYLVLSYAEEDKVALRVGFSCAANAVGRLIGTIASGSVYAAAATPALGLRHALIAAIALVALSALVCLPLRRAERRHGSDGIIGRANLTS